MREIALRPVRAETSVQVPGSKSYTHRMLIAAALSNGTCRIDNPLLSQDTLLTLAGLKQLGVAVAEHEGYLRIHGVAGRLGACETPIYLGNAGTAMRLLTGTVVLGRGAYTLTGTQRMCERPIESLLESLRELGVDARSLNADGCPPITIEGGRCKGGHTRIDCSVSSQYLSALMLIGPCLANGLTIDVIKGPVSKPYIDLTADIMEAFGISLQRRGYAHFDIAGNQIYQAGDYTVEADGSQAGYFWGAAAITGKRVKVQGVTAASRQGDVGLAAIFERMGCRVDYEPDGITVTGGPLRAVDVDMGDMPDMVPTLAVVAAFAQGTSLLRNVAHLRAKESDRLAAVRRELAKMGIQTTESHDELRITGGTPSGAEIETYDDHRIAMSFAMAGLKIPHMRIKDERCVDKSFPNFWHVFENLYA